VDPRVRYIKGRAYYEVQPQKDTFIELSIELDNKLTIDSIYLQGKKTTFNRIAGDNTTITLSNIYTRKDALNFEVFYQGIPSDTIRGFTQEKHNTGHVIWTLSEPYAAKIWFPCKQSLEDKIDSLDITIKTPVGYKAGTNGLLVDSLKEDTFITYYWKHRYPIGYYHISLAVSNYKSFSWMMPRSTGDSFEVLNYVFPHDEEKWRQQSAENERPTMEYLIDLLGPYPFEKEKYGNAQFIFPGGMEHQTMSSMRDLGLTLNAHEVAHQWFGNKITCRTWKDIWLNESFANLCEGLILEKLKPKEDFINWRKGILKNILSDDKGSVYVDDTTSVSRIFGGRLTYHKGGLILHQFRLCH
jgi:aminopeptidase N